VGSPWFSFICSRPTHIKEDMKSSGLFCKDVFALREFTGFIGWMQTDWLTKQSTNLDWVCQKRLLPSASTIAVYHYSAPKTHTHFTTVPRRVKGYSHPRQCSEARSPCPRLCIAVAVMMPVRLEPGTSQTQISYYVIIIPLRPANIGN